MADAVTVIKVDVESYTAKSPCKVIEKSRGICKK